MLEKSLKAQRSEKKPKDTLLKDKNAKLEDKLKEVYALLKEEKKKSTNLENSVASMEKSIIQTEAKLASVEAEKQKLNDEKCRHLDARQCQIEEAMKDEVNKNESLERSAEEHKKELDQLEDLQCDLQARIQEVLLLLLMDNDNLRARLDQEARERAQETAALRERLDKECGDLRDRLAKEAEERKVTISYNMPHFIYLFLRNID